MGLEIASMHFLFDNQYIIVKSNQILYYAAMEIMNIFIRAKKSSVYHVPIHKAKEPDWIHKQPVVPRMGRNA